MSEKGLTNISLKKINKSKVYQYIYRKKTTSKLQIVQELQMGLSTVSQNLNLLEQEGLIEKNGFFESTGGRKANALQIVSDFKISIGIGILKGMFHITAVDLYGNAFYTDTIPLPYSNTPDYYKQVTDAVKEFISSRQYDNDKVLGISIATQGITSPDHTTVLYGDIMNNAGMKLDDFSRYLPYPCYLEHDSKSAAFLELWNHPELDSAVIILLNRNLGGGIITNHQIHQGISMHSGTLEHICINPDGPLCYCGSRGCLETYCSANALEQAAGIPAKEFFPLLREKKSPQIIQIWKDYLNHLAFAMKNLNLVIDAPIILSGYLAPYFTEEDIEYLTEHLHTAAPFILDKTLDDFSRYLPYPCYLEHDSKSAAFLELWNHPELDSAVIILLNRNLGGGIITNHQIHQGISMHSGTLEHICINPDGPLCYCGSRGCLETYCSANALEQAAGIPAKEFFPLLREKKSPQIIQIWKDYLNHLAFAMKNLNLVIDAPIILSGYLAPYFTEEDIEYLAEHLHTAAPFILDKTQILVGTNGQYTPAIGAALHYVEEFIQSI